MERIAENAFPYLRSTPGVLLLLLSAKTRRDQKYNKLIQQTGGLVYKADDTNLKRLVAIKFLRHQIAASEEAPERSGSKSKREPRRR